MSKQVLIIEDDVGVAKVIAEVCAGLGLESAHVKSGAEAVKRFDAQPADLVVLDLLLPGGMDGFKVGEALREHPHGRAVPIVVVSGFLKDPKSQRDLQTRLTVSAMLQKPFKAEELRQALAGPLHLDARPLSNPAALARPVTDPGTLQARVGLDSFDATVAERPVAALFGELFRTKAEGVLELTRGNAKKRFYVQRGYFRYATSNIRAETLAGLLGARGVPEARINEALAQAKARGLALHDAIVDLGLASAREIPSLMVAQTEEVALTAIAWTDGALSFRANAVNKGPEARANPILCALKGIKRAFTPEQARARLITEPTAVLERTAELDRELFAIRALFPGETLSPAINGKSTQAELLGRAKEPDLQLLLALRLTGLAPARDARPITSRALPAVSAAPAHRFTEEERTSREGVRVETARLEAAQDHYQVLGIDRRSDAADIKSAYLSRARRFHVDAFSGQELGDQAEALEQIFKRLTEANAALSDPGERENYDLMLDRQARGLPTDMDVILRAESAFTRAEALRTAGRLRDAAALFREAASLNPGDPNLLVGHAQALWQQQGKSTAREVLESLDKALGLGQDFRPALALKAQVLLETGEAKSAVELARKLLAFNPLDAQARDILNRGKQALAGAGSEKGGLLGKLFGGKGK